MRIYKVTVENEDFEVEVKSFSMEKAELVVNGKGYVAAISGVSHNGVEPFVKAVSLPTPARPLPATPAAPPIPSAPAGEGTGVIAPIPGAVFKLLVAEGDAVEAGQTVVVMEAMKMENDIKTTTAGTVTAVNVAVGDAVSQGQVLVTVG